MQQVYPAETIDEPENGLTPYFGPAGNELHARSFIAPNVDDWGRTISPAVWDGYGSEAQAQRARGQLEYDKLVDDGASPEEAYLRTMHLLLWNEPEKQAVAINRLRDRTPATPQPFKPFVETLDGVKVLHTSNGAVERVPDPREAAVKPSTAPKIPADAKAAQDALQRQINETYKQIDSDYRIATKPDADPDEKNAAARRVITARERVAALDQQFQKGTTNWMAQPPAVQAMPGAPTQPIKPPPAEDVTEVERTTKDGKIAIFDGNTKRFLRYK